MAEARLGGRRHVVFRRACGGATSPGYLTAARRVQAGVRRRLVARRAGGGASSRDERNEENNRFSPNRAFQVLIGCDGVSSVVAKWLGLPKPILSGRSATRGLAEYPGGHCFGPEILQFIGQGFRSGVLPCSDTSVYWNYTWYPSPADGDAEESVAKMRNHVLGKLRAAKIPAAALDAIERSEMSGVVSSPLRFRSPLALLRGSISRGGVCVAGDALHPMTPELGQGGCAALEDGVVLARCLGEAFAAATMGAALEKYAEARRWRSIQLITAAYVVGFIQQSNNVVVKFLRDTFLSPLLAKTLVAMADYDCGTL
uniref:FAD-binding domain-containing protein n=1 Tax=Setaria viridis TaxID=4556 RepID=A0A4U6TL67_SETVI|nr:LOW QUALITY PROTEIN: hypothetical protein SEVIR_9G540300v2 [Setaria viridis]